MQAQNAKTGDNKNLIEKPNLTINENNANLFILQITYEYLNEYTIIIIIKHLNKRKNDFFSLFFEI